MGRTSLRAANAVRVAERKSGGQGGRGREAIKTDRDASRWGRPLPGHQCRAVEKIENRGALPECGRCDVMRK